MSVSALNGGSSPWDVMRQRRAALQQMEAAVTSGDIKSAQQNLATAKQLAGSDASGSSQGSADAGKGGGSSFRSTLKADLSALEAAVAAGNITDAQGALSKLNADKAADKPQDPAAALSKNMVALIEAALKGDTEGMKKAAAAVQSDLDALLGPSDAPGAKPIEASGATGTDPLLDDLKTLLKAAQGNDKDAMQKAAQKLLQDLQKSNGDVQQVGHAHHGAPAQALSEYEQSMAQYEEMGGLDISATSAMLTPEGSSDTTVVL